MKSKYWIICIVALAAVLQSCVTPSKCPKAPAQGNMGSIFNSDLDEYSPHFFDGNLYFTATRKDQKKEETIYKSKFENGKFSNPTVDTTLPLKFYQNSGLPYFFRRADGVVELYFAAISKESKRVNRDIYYSELKDGVWSKPTPIREINSSAYESHPALSADGKTLIFSSDREGGLGEIDLYISRRDENGKWTKPLNLGKNINTALNEITPFISKDGLLYFASQGYSQKKNYELIKAEPNPESLWTASKALFAPANTEFDETGPAIFQDKIYLASNRRGGCGGRDLYAFQLCGNARLDGEITSKSADTDLEGKVELLSTEGELWQSKKVDKSGLFSFNLMPMNEYVVKFTNNCGQTAEQQRFLVPCNDSNFVVIKTQIEINSENELNLSEASVPFFVTGYYLPNTSENLEALRLKFAYNMIGNDLSTKYVENPGAKYDEYAPEVEKTLDQAADFILNTVSNMKGICNKLENNNIRIKITGYADPRPISKDAVYFDFNIEDEEYNFKLEKGTAMDNNLLSKLRAYFTAKHFEKLLMQHPEYNSIKDKINWTVEGMGVDTSDSSYEEKRRVNIKIELEQN